MDGGYISPVRVDLHGVCEIEVRLHRHSDFATLDIMARGEGCAVELTMFGHGPDIPDLLGILAAAIEKARGDA